MTPEVYPRSLARPAEGVVRITWSDGQTRDYRARELRDACPCASCREKRGAAPASPSSLTVLSLAETQPLGVETMRPVGNYAYAIYFSDGHKNGIFTFAHLRELGTEIAAP